MCLRAEELAELRAAEAAAGWQPDPLTDPLLDAETVQGKRESIMTDYRLKLLGLDVSFLPTTLVCTKTSEMQALTDKVTDSWMQFGSGLLKSKEPLTTAAARGTVWSRLLLCRCVQTRWWGMPWCAA